ncbi:Omp28-related outer membrane protein [Desulfosarcina sp.]|nr:Omp28-related outer membrane protein [Desulfosarcina sp.]
MGKVVAVATHADSDPMHNDLYDSFKNDRTTNNSIPAFWVGDVKTTDLDEMTTLLSQTPIAGIGITSSINGTTMTVNTQVKFFEDAEGEYYLSVLVLESGIDGSSSAGAYAQSGTNSPNSYQHDFVLRASSVEGNAYGELILTDPVNGGTTDNSFEILLNSAWNKSVYPVAILWKKDESSTPNYKYINAAS